MSQDPFRPAPKRRGHPAVSEIPPAGTVRDVLAWVALSPDRARSAILAEKVRAEGPRTSLVARLQAMVRG